MSRSNPYRWMFYFWLPFQLWRLVTRPTCSIISNGFLFCIPQKFYFYFWSKKSRQKATEIEIAFFHPLGNPKDRTLDHFFYASHIRHNFPYKLIPISMSRNISEIINENSLNTFNYLDDISLQHSSTWAPWRYDFWIQGFSVFQWWSWWKIWRR